MIIAKDVCELIGRTPMLELKKLFAESPCRIVAKLECMNPTSIKDRAVLGMIRAAIAAGNVKPETEVVEASSGNAAIAIASLGATLGFKARLYMSELCGIERQQLMCAYGAKVILTPANEHTRGARERAIAYCQANPHSTFFLNQHGNPENGRAHELTTAPEIWEQTQGKLDAIVIGLGTAGTFDGVSRFLKNKNPNVCIVGVEPAASPVYSGGKQGEHHIIGIGPGFVTENFQRSKHNLDEILQVEDEVAFDWARQVTRREGIIVGPTSGATVWGASQLAQRPRFAGKTIVCFFYDSGERYLASGLFPADNVERVA
jgi:cysteine synthase A